MLTTPKESHYLPEDEYLEDYEKSVFTVAKRRVIKELFSRTSPVVLADLLKKTRISINSMVAIYLELSKLGYLNYSPEGFTLSQAGRIWALKARKNIFMKKIKFSHSGRVFNEAHKQKISDERTLPKKYHFSSVDMKNMKMLKSTASPASEGESPFG